MRGVFDEKEADRESRDTELTLSAGSLIAMGCGLLVLCGLCFGLGYATGHSGSAAAAKSATPSANDQEPLQASGNIPKPSAVEQTPVSAPQPPGTSAVGGNPTDSVAGGASAQSEVHAALPATGAGSQGAITSSSPLVHPAFSQAQSQATGQQFMVQVAAVSNAGDAEVLANALKKRGYPVVSKREPADNFIHVRVGPFASHQVADDWRMKLLNDGYNAQVQP